MKNLPTRTSPRRSDYDDTSSGAYFVTICTVGRQHYFWEVEDGEMRLNDIGKICEQKIKHIEQSRSYVEIHEYIVMPNHIHILLILWSKQPL
jgi:REP element-mobilizing transposase RayT